MKEDYANLVQDHLQELFRRIGFLCQRHKRVNQPKSRLNGVAEHEKNARITSVDAQQERPESVNRHRQAGRDGDERYGRNQWLQCESIHRGIKMAVGADGPD